MRKVVIVVILLVVLVAGYFVAAHFSGGSLPTFGLPVGGESASVRQSALSFAEDLHFRDLAGASRLFAPPDQNVESVQAFLQKSFAATADQLDLTEYAVGNVEVDSTGTRARVMLKIKAKNLLTGKVLQPEMLLFFRRVSETQPWSIVAR